MNADELRALALRMAERDPRMANVIDGLDHIDEEPDCDCEDSWREIERQFDEKGMLLGEFLPVQRRIPAVASGYSKVSASGYPERRAAANPDSPKPPTGVRLRQAVSGNQQ